MLAAIIGFIGYFASSGATLGANLINAFDWVLTYYWITSSILGVIVIGLALFIVFGVTSKGQEIGGDAGGVVGFLAGGAIGTTFAVIFLVRAAILIFCGTYLVDSLDPAMTTLDSVTSNQWGAFGAIVAMHVLSILNRTSSSSSS